MKRTGIQRRTPLRPKTRLKPIGRRGKMVRLMDQAVSRKVRSRGICELRDIFPKVICIGELTHHHIVPRANKETRWDEKNGICCCLNHHRFLHYHPTEARRLGLIVDSKSNLLDI